MKLEAPAPTVGRRTGERAPGLEFWKANPHLQPGRASPSQCPHSLLSRHLILVTSALMKGSREWGNRPVTSFSRIIHEPALGPLADDLLLAPFPLLPVESRARR